MRLTRCKSCNKEIYWLPTKKGNSMPTNAESLTEEEKRIIESGRPLVFEHGKHVSHFSDCPNAKQHRRTEK